MHQRLKPFANAVGAALLLSTLGASLADETNGNSLRQITAEPAAWQGPALTAQLVPPAPRDPIAPNAAVPSPASSPTTPAPAEIVTPSSTPKQNESPLLDGKLPAEELLPPVVSEGSCSEGGHQGVQPYGGGHPTDWSWGCGGNPYRTGPGLCDNWKVGPRWHITVDGLVMHRESTDLAMLAEKMFENDHTGTLSDPANVNSRLIPDTEQFGYGPGGRITFTSQVGRCTQYDIQAVYEGINDWDSSVVFPKQSLPNVTLVIPPSPNTEPPGTNPPLTFPEGFQQRSLHYRSNMNSVELNWLPNHDSEWRPTFGARFIRFDDEINDSVNQERQIPLPGPRTDFIGPVSPPTIAVNDPIGPTWETDRANIFHLQNNLMGFHVGLLKDTLQLSDRFAIEGFVDGGVYYNKVKYSNVMIVTTNQTFADNTRTGSGARTDVSTIENNDARDISEISYEAEASLTGVCRLNKCWALRGGYQVLWINHLHLADAAFLGNPEADSDLLFHGWHAGFECRR